METSGPNGSDQSRVEAAWAASVVEAARSEDPMVPGTSDDLHKVCLAARSGLTLMGSANRLGASGEDAADGIAASSDAAARALAELQFDANEGPGLEALRLRRPILVPDVERSAKRWPGFALLAAGQGLGAVFSFPLHEGAVCFGVLELYDGTPRALTEQETARAMALARIATQVLLDPHEWGGLGELEPGVAKTLERAVVYQAQGMVMVDLGVTLAEAMVRMRGRAFSENLSLEALARRIVDSGEKADSWDGSDGHRPPRDTDG